MLRQSFEIIGLVDPVRLLKHTYDNVLHAVVRLHLVHHQAPL